MNHPGYRQLKAEETIQPGDGFFVEHPYGHKFLAYEPFDKSDFGTVTGLMTGMGAYRPICSEPIKVTGIDMDPTPRERLEMHLERNPDYQALLDVVDDFEARIKKLETPPDVHDCKGESHIPERFLAGAPIPEGHPIPNYDYNTAVAIKAMAEAGLEVDRLYETLALNAAEEYVENYKEYKTLKSQDEIRKWGEKNYRLHCNLVNAVEMITDEDTD